MPITNKEMQENAGQVPTKLVPTKHIKPMILTSRKGAGKLVSDAQNY